jgi:hypothetical protein
VPAIKIESSPGVHICVTSESHRNKRMIMLVDTEYSTIIATSSPDNGFYSKYATAHLL